jgi:DNA-binding LytR/AlgR family response regulator
MARRLRARVTDPPAHLEGLLQALAERLNATRDYMRFITAVHRDEIRLITVDEICYFQADNKYTRVVTPERESLIRRPISELADSVDPKIFWQIHAARSSTSTRLRGSSATSRGICASS